MRRSRYTNMPRVVRLIWIAAHLISHDSVNPAEYQHLFGMSMYTFRYELMKVREAGWGFRFYFYLLFSFMICQWLTGER